MLPPQLQGGTAVSKYRIASSGALRPSTPLLQSRSFWGGRRPRDWTSQHDATYHHHARLHTHKTRVRLLKSLQRRRAFDWDVSTRPFFTPRHLRWASHWRGRQWYTNDDPKKVKEDAAAKETKQTEKDGYELSKREQEWREQMEAMRKRIQQDPYEAVFGKRFEPFWSPLVPSWMREEMGPQGWLKDGVKKTGRPAMAARADEGPSLQKMQKEIEHRVRNDSEAQQGARRASSHLEQSTKQIRERVASKERSFANDSSRPFSRMTREEKERHVVDTTAQQCSSEMDNLKPKPSPQSYAYASSTTWDSATNKTKTVEWNSQSSQTKTFEYDPISNRMIEVAAPEQVAIESDSSAARQSVDSVKGNPATPGEGSTITVDIPVRQSNGIRKAIPIPPPLSHPSHSITLGYTQTSIGPVKTTAVSSTPVKPAALAKPPAQDLDLLTAEHVRASMGKTKDVQHAEKASSPAEKAQLERECDSNFRASDAEVDAILKARVAGKQREPVASWWVQAELEDILTREMDGLNKKQEKLLKCEDGLFHIERQKRDLKLLDDRRKALMKRLNEVEGGSGDRSPSAKLQTSLQRAEAKNSSPLLQSSVKRMQSKELPTAVEQDLDDAAAHESTEPAEQKTSVPKDWNKAADLLQAERVKRAASKRPYPMTRWIDDMNARKVAYEQRKAEAQAVEDAKNTEANAKLEKVNKMLEAEVAEQKFRMQAFEGRYAQKVKSLRCELDTAFKQSSVHSEKHLERIHELEAQLTGLKDKEVKYAQKVKSLRDELEMAYKQSAVHGEKHLERIRYLESELENSLKKPALPPRPTAKSQPEEMPAEGDICTNAPKFDTNGKWYKRPANPVWPTSEEMERAEQKVRDQALVKEVRDIYENAYGVIDENHEQARAHPQVATSLHAEQPTPVQWTKADKRAERRAHREAEREEKARRIVKMESDIDLGQELAKYEKANPEDRESDAALTAPESADKMKSVVASSLENELNTSGWDVKPSATSVQWAEPPLYKVLAYDSGNDMMSSATTTTSILPGSADERPLGIPEALSQLYQPARFVPYFAELQSDNFQAIAATREIIVFRQVKKSREASQSQCLEDHGLYSSGAERSVANTKGNGSSAADSARRRDDAGANPIDGTPRRHMEPTTGNFASPTGFVNHDPVFSPEEAQEQELSGEHEAVAAGGSRSDTYSTIAKEPLEKTSRQIWESLPGSNETPVRRTESVFSGMNKRELTKYERTCMTRPERHAQAKEIYAAQERGRLRNVAKKAEKEAKRRGEPTQPHPSFVGKDSEQSTQHDGKSTEGESTRSSWSIAFSYALGVGLGTASLMYLVGMLAEKERLAEESKNMAPQWEQYEKLKGEEKRLEDEVARMAREWERR